jgi:hypothetical protein
MKKIKNKLKNQNGFENLYLIYHRRKQMKKLVIFILLAMLFGACSSNANDNVDEANEIFGEADVKGMFIGTMPDKTIIAVEFDGKDIVTHYVGSSKNELFPVIKMNYKVEGKDIFVTAASKININEIANSLLTVMFNIKNKNTITYFLLPRESGFVGIPLKRKR